MGKKRIFLLYQIIPMLALVTLVFILAATPAAGATLNVGCAEDLTSRANELINAINTANADPGLDVLVLSAGCQYALSTLYSGSEASATGLPIVQSAITISGNGATILRADTAPAFRIFQVDENGSLTLNDLILMNAGTLGDGGAINARSPLTLTNVTFLHNTTAGLGGAIYAEGATTISSSHFEDNTSNRGGAVFVRKESIIDGTIFVNNTAQVHGGAVYADAAATVRNSRFEHNQSIEGTGGALYVDHGLTTIAGSTFVTNSAGSNGGGAVIWNAAVTVTGSQFTHNSAGGYGGGLFVHEALSMTSSVFIANNSVQGGGGIYVGHTDSSSQTYIANSLFARNWADGEPAAMYLMPFWGEGGHAEVVHVTVTSPTLVLNSAVRVDVGEFFMADSIVTHHDTALAAGQVLTATVDHNLYFANPQNYVGIVNDSGSLLNDDPKFVDPSNDNYRLGPGSPAIDTAHDLGIAVDLEGAPRPGSGSIYSDRGAYERQGVMANLFLRKSVRTRSTLTQLLPGEPITYTLVVSNVGTGLATGIVMTDLVPETITDLAYTYSGASAMDAGASAPFVWKIQDLPPGMASIVTLTGKIDGSLTKEFTLTNTAYVAADQESTLSDNSDSVSVTVMPYHETVYLPTVLRG